MPDGQPPTIPASWELDAAFVRYPGLRAVPSRENDIVLHGPFSFTAEGRGVAITETYEVEIRVPLGFPQQVPSVTEVGGRIPRDFHRHQDRSLCLGAPARVALAVLQTPTVPGFLEGLLVPYLFGHAYFERYGAMPFGELAHGTAGLNTDWKALLRMPAGTNGRAVLVAGSMRRRVANKLRCPCGSGLRLGRCHNHKINQLRLRLGRRWFRGQLGAFDRMSSPRG
jgi:hypothetical protein